MVKINGKEYNVRSGDVFMSKHTGIKMYVDTVSRGDVFYHTDECSITMVTIEKLFNFCDKVNA